ncbi:unnamed protein product [Paramecium octaurelia]|uniref:Uncharacterized protein n=1 Tax=Paramecium octaurelia TaxID=43137 RepID=A0A8S1VRA6_PAROT|nr:unnamed protein product [Paramecium octaurelia]
MDNFQMITNRLRHYDQCAFSYSFLLIQPLGQIQRFLRIVITFQNQTKFFDQNTITEKQFKYSKIEYSILLINCTTNSAKFCKNLTLIVNFDLRFKVKQEQQKFGKIKHSELQNSLQELWKLGVRRKQLRFVALFLRIYCNKNNKKSSNYTILKSKIKKDQEEIQKEPKQQNDDFKLKNANLMEVIKYKEPYIQNLKCFTFSEIYKTILSYHKTQDYIQQRSISLCLGDQGIPNQGIVRFCQQTHDVISSQTMVVKRAREIILRSGYSSKEQRITIQFLTLILQ